MFKITGLREDGTPVEIVTIVDCSTAEKVVNNDGEFMLVKSGEIEETVTFESFKIDCI